MKKLFVLPLILFLLLGCANSGSRFNPERANPSTVSILNGQEISPRALQDDLKFYLDMIFGLLPTLSESSGGLMTEIGNVFNLILAGGGGTCPVVTVNPPLSGLTLPTAITVVADYGGGCVASDGSTMSGSWKLQLTNITQNLTAISANYVFTMSNLTQDGVLLANGSVSGSLAMAPSGSDQKITVTATTSGMQVSQYASISGAVTIVAIGQVGLDGAVFDTITVTPSNLTLAYNFMLLSGEYNIRSGSVVSTRRGSSENFDVQANLRTSSGSIKGTALVESPTGGYYRVSTTGGAFAVHSYDVTAENVVLEPNVCIYPRSGTVYVTKGSEETGVSFPGSCDGTYNFF